VEWHCSHACKSFKRAGVGTNGILECKILPENTHRTSVSAGTVGSSWLYVSGPLTTISIGMVAAL
jgi:hypothetical protein